VSIWFFHLWSYWWFCLLFVGAAFVHTQCANHWWYRLWNYEARLVTIDAYVYISVEYWLHKKCAYPERQLFDWGLMRIQYPLSMYRIGDPFNGCWRCSPQKEIYRGLRNISSYICGNLYLVETMIPMLVLSDFRGCQDSKRKKKIRQISGSESSLQKF
jgi:hypothetical protein